jgi:hypothetical protein
VLHPASIAVLRGACLFAVRTSLELTADAAMSRCRVPLQPGDLRPLVRALKAGVGSHLLVELQPEQCTMVAFVANVHLVAR